MKQAELALKKQNTGSPNVIFVRITKYIGDLWIVPRSSLALFLFEGFK